MRDVARDGSDLGVYAQRKGTSLYFPGPNGVLRNAAPPPFVTDLRVLVIQRRLEDRAAIRESLMRIGVPGDRIALADDLATSMFVYHVFHPTVVIVDVEMPAAHGTNVGRTLLSIDPSLRFIALTGLDPIHPKVQSLHFNRAFTVLRRPAGDAALRQALEESIKAPARARARPAETARPGEAVEI